MFVKLLIPRVAILLHDDDFSVGALVLIMLIHRFAEEDGNDEDNDFKNDTNKYVFRFFRIEELNNIGKQYIDKQYPKCPADHASIFIPLHPTVAGAEQVAQVEPRPFGCPMVGEVFKSEPIGDEEKVTPRLVAHFFLCEMERTENGSHK